METLTERIDRIREEIRLHGVVVCAHCGHVENDSCDISESGLITYHGEDNEVEWDCIKCEKTSLVTENVVRTYESKKKEEVS